MKPKKINLENFSKPGEKSCEGKCNRQVIPTKTGPIIICLGCSRIVIDNRKP